MNGTQEESNINIETIEWLMIDSHTTKPLFLYNKPSSDSDYCFRRRCISVFWNSASDNLQPIIKSKSVIDIFVKM